MHVGQFGRTGSGGFDASSSIWEHRGSWAPALCVYGYQKCHVWIPSWTTSNSIRSSGGSRPAVEVITELLTEANADCAINRFPSMFVSSFVTLIGFDWLKAFIRYFFTFTGLTNLVRKVMRGGPLPLHKLSGRILQHDRLHHGRHPSRPDWASGHQRSDRRAYNI